MKQNHDFINFSLLTIRQATERGADLCSESDWKDICSAFKIFSDSLVSHMNDEDSNCYNQVDVNTDCEPLFYRLISDHINIRKLIDECQVLINLTDRSQFSILFLQLDMLLEEHSIREENLMGLISEKLEASTIRIIELLRNIHNNH